MGRPRAAPRPRDRVRRERALHARARVGGAGRAARDGAARTPRPARPRRARGAAARAAASARWWRRRGRPGWARSTTSARSPTCARARRAAARRRRVRRLLRLLADGGEPGVAAAPFAAIARADSVVVDPHKHGLQPYGCGCVLFADPAVGRLYAHDSPYTYFTSGELHLGEISLECSRAGAAAAALWTTLRALPLTRAGLGRHLGGRARGGAGARGRARRDDRARPWWSSRRSTSSAPRPARRRPPRARRPSAAFDTLAAPAGTSPSCAWPPTGCARATPRSRRRRGGDHGRCAAACSSRSTRRSAGARRRDRGGARRG